MGQFLLEKQILKSAHGDGMIPFPQGPFLTIERTFAMLDSLARRGYVECVCKTWYRAYWITVKGCGSLVPVGGFSLLPVRIQGRMLLVGEARWLPNPDGRLANGIGLADSDGASANARIRFTNSTGALSNGVWLADSDGCCADAGIRPVFSESLIFSAQLGERSQGPVSQDLKMPRPPYCEAEQNH